MTELLKRSGFQINHKRVERLWVEESLPLPRKRKRRRQETPLTNRPSPATRPNEVWSLDFVHDRTYYGQKLKMLTIVDEFTRECLEIRVEKRMKSQEVIETLDEIVTDRGAPKYLRSDNGSEFVSSLTTEWLKEKGVEPIHIEPGCPWENGFVESFNGKLREECLNEEIFWSRAEAQVLVDWWRQSYNQDRPHSSLGFKTPAEFANLNNGNKN
jgi:putative transposase